MRLTGLASSGSGSPLFSDADGDVFRRALGKADLPATVGYTDEAETWSLLQTFTSGLTSNGAVQVNSTLGVSGATTLGSTLAVTGLATFDGGAQSNGYTSLTTGWGVTTAGAADFRYVYTDELHAKQFIADLEMALNGGQTIAKSTVILAATFTCPPPLGTTTLRVRDFPGFPNVRVFADDDWVVLRTFSRTDGDSDGHTDLTIGDCVGQVSSYTDESDNTQSWTFMRGSGGSAGSLSSSTVIAADAVVIDYGVSGQGFLVARANDGPEGAHSPYWQVNTWSTAPVAGNMVAQMRCGQLNGAYGYTAATYGCAFGPSTGAWVAVEPTNGIRFMDGSNARLQMTTSSLTMWDDAGARALYLGDLGGGAYGAAIGDPFTTNRPFVQATSSNVSLCVAGAACQVALSSAGTISLKDANSVERVLISASNGVLVGRPSEGHVWADTSGGVRFRYGATNRLYIGGTSAVFYQPDGTPGTYIDNNGIYIGYPFTATNAYMRASSTALTFCAAGLGCTLTLDGTTGNITSTGSFIFAGTGTVGGAFTVGTSGRIQSGKTSYGLGTGWLMDYNGGTPRFDIGSASRYLRWTGTDIHIAGDNFSISSSGITAGDVTLNSSGLSTARVQIDDDGIRVANADGAFRISSEYLKLDTHGHFVFSEILHQPTIWSDYLDVGYITSGTSLIIFDQTIGRTGVWNLTTAGALTIPTVNVTSTLQANGSSGLTTNVMVLGDGSTWCTLTFSKGLLTSENCP